MGSWPRGLLRGYMKAAGIEGLAMIGDRAAFKEGVELILGSKTYPGADPAEHLRVGIRCVNGYFGGKGGWVIPSKSWRVLTRDVPEEDEFMALGKDIAAWWAKNKARFE